MKKQDTVAVIVAAGQGTRMSKKYNKLLLPLGTRTIVEYSLDAFLNHGRIRKIFLAVSSKYLNPACLISLTIIPKIFLPD